MKKTKYFIFPIVLVFILLLVFTIPTTSANGQTSVNQITVDIFEGIYYNSNNNLYIWVKKNDFLEDERYYVTYYNTEDGLIKDSLIWAEAMVYNTGDLYKIGPQSSNFYSYYWIGVTHVDILVNLGYHFYVVYFGVTQPPVNELYRMVEYETNKIVSIYPAKKVDEIVDYIDSLGGLNEEDLQNAFNSGYDLGYSAGYNYGYNIGHNNGYGEGVEDGETIGYNQGYEQGYNAGYQIGYNTGINEQLANKDFAYLLRSAFVAIGAFLGINLLPGISIGAIIAVPIVFGIIAFVLGKRND